MVQAAAMFLTHKGVGYFFHCLPRLMFCILYCKLASAVLSDGGPGNSHNKVLRLGGTLRRAGVVAPKRRDGQGASVYRSVSPSVGRSVDRYLSVGMFIRRWVIRLIC